MSLPAAMLGSDVPCAKCRCLFVAYSAEPAVDPSPVAPPDWQMIRLIIYGCILLIVVVGLVGGWIISLISR
jgi:hypothetical protein